MEEFWSAAVHTQADVHDPWGEHDIEYWVWCDGTLVPASPEQQARITEDERTRAALWRLRQATGVPSLPGRLVRRCKSWAHVVLRGAWPHVALRMAPLERAPTSHAARHDDGAVQSPAPEGRQHRT